MSSKVVRIGIIGTGRWTQAAHIPAFQRCKRAKIVGICGHDKDRTQDVAKRFGIPIICTDHQELLQRDEVDAIDITTSTSRHFQVALDAIEVGKPILCEKPLAASYKEARILHEKAAAKGVRTKIGFTFRYSPVMLRMKELIDSGFIGTPYHFNGFEQNSQFIDPSTPFRWNPSSNPDIIMLGSLEEYAPHLIDLALWLMGDLRAVVGHMKNFIPERMIRDHNKVLPINIEDGCIWLGEFEKGAQATFQSSFVAVGGYPGIEIRIFGSKGALIGRIVEEFGITESLKAATPDKVEFVPIRIPARLYPSGYSKDESWVQVHFGNLVQHFVDEILNGEKSEGNFLDGAKSEEVATAVYLSHLEKRWLTLPLE
jgi:predicted dehydrogenase